MKSPEGHGFLFWPGLIVLRMRSRLVIFFTAFFYLFYGGAAWLADFIPWRFTAVFPWEDQIPFLPETAIIYTSVTGLMLLSLFVIRDIDDLRHLLRVLCQQTMIAAAFFILVPLSDGFPPPYPYEALPLIFRIADTINLHNNNLPSLHVCFAFTIAAVLSHYSSRRQALLLCGWATLIALSALTIHAHTLVDLIGGMLLAAWGARQWRAKAQQFRVAGAVGRQ